MHTVSKQTHPTGERYLTPLLWHLFSGLFNPLGGLWGGQKEVLEGIVLKDTLVHLIGR